MNIENSWDRVLDDLKQKEGLQSDAALARKLKVSRAFISAIRRGIKNMPPELGEKVFTLLGESITNSKLAMFAPIRIKEISSKLESNEYNLTKKLTVKRAGGKCELCGNKAPFQLPNGLPYLEVFHLNSISNGEIDARQNMVALCPNCHRKMQFIPTPAELLHLSQKAKKSN